MTRQSESARIAMRHKTGSVGNLLGQKTPKTKGSRDFLRDNVKRVRAMSRDVRRERRESEMPSDPSFKLQQFANVASRLHQTPHRVTARLQEMASQTPSRVRSLSVPGFSPAKTSPPELAKVASSPWARGPLRPCNQPIRRHKGKDRELSKIQSSNATELGASSVEQENRPGARLLFSPPPRTEVSSGPSRSPEEVVEFSSSRSPETEIPGWWPEDSDLCCPYADFEPLPIPRRPGRYAGCSVQAIADGADQDPPRNQHQFFRDHRGRPRQQPAQATERAEQDRPKFFKALGLCAMVLFAVLSLCWLHAQGLNVLNNSARNDTATENFTLPSAEGFRDTKVWGPPTWFFLHSLTLALPEEVPREQQAQIKNLLVSLREVLPCAQCSDHWREQMEEVTSSKYPAPPHSIIAFGGWHEP
ncbi:unnamed protein product [Durusdinium trenchii]|uniref:Sulfhydryl oxidase n=1 Tax=Durusdinium trenchii TaxID=1381693 RepID=A0ABP0J1S8_9DINO